MKIRLAVIPPPDDIPSVRSSETSAHPEAVGSGHIQRHRNPRLCNDQPGVLFLAAAVRDKLLYRLSVLRSYGCYVRQSGGGHPGLSYIPCQAGLNLLALLHRQGCSEAAAHYRDLAERP